MSTNIAQRITTLFLIALHTLCAGCAGPSSPLGAPWATNGSEVKNGPLAFMTSIFENYKPGSNVLFYPPRQVLHAKTPLRVRIKDRAGVKDDFHLVVRHNGLDVTRNFLRAAKVTRIDSNEVELTFKDLGLSPKRDHLIEIIYGGFSTLQAYGKLAPPECRAISSSPSGLTPEFEKALALQKISFVPQDLKTIATAWSTPEWKSKIKSHFAKPEVEITRLILTSQQLGLTTVQKAFEKYGPGWFSSHEIKKARSVAQIVTSRCDELAGYL